MFEDSIRDLMLILFNLICATIVIALGVSSLVVLRSLGTALTVERVDSQYVQSVYRYDGIDDTLFTRDQMVALILDNIAKEDFEMVIRLNDTETREQIETDKRIFNRDNYISKPADYTAEAIKDRADSTATYKAYLVYKGVDPTTITEAHGATNRSDYVTGIVFIKQ